MRRSKNSSLPQFVYEQRIRKNGRLHVYYRFRRGKVTIRLPGEPGSPEFHAAYAKLLRGHVEIGRYTPGSVAHTINLYLASAPFSQLSEATQRDYRRYLARVDSSIGEQPMQAIDEDYIFGLQDKLKGTPVAANHAISVIRALFAFARPRKIVAHDPTKGVERLKGGEGYRRWPADQIELFRAKADPMMRLAMELGLYTGQRLADVIRLAWSNYDGERVKLRQQKTKAHLVIPVHPDLKALLDAAPRIGAMILTTKTGLAYGTRTFSRDFLRARKAAGTDPDLSFHGLRHTAASNLAELGSGAPEIQAITGHKSLKQVEHYIRQANQERQAVAAISRLPRRPA